MAFYCHEDSILRGHDCCAEGGRHSKCHPFFPLVTPKVIGRQILPRGPKRHRITSGSHKHYDSRRFYFTRRRRRLDLEIPTVGMVQESGSHRGLCGAFHGYSSPGGTIYNWGQGYAGTTGPTANRRRNHDRCKSDPQIISLVSRSFKGPRDIWGILSYDSSNKLITLPDQG